MAVGGRLTTPYKPMEPLFCRRFLPGGDLFKWIEMKNRFSFVGILNIPDVVFSVGP